MIVIEKAQLAEITKHSEDAYPYECCGLLVGQFRREHAYVAEAHKSSNIASQPRKLFEVDPQLRFDLEKRLRGDSLSLVGVYHSHPEGEAIPSKTDVERAWEQNMVWLITSVKNGNVALTAAYLVVEPQTKFVEIPMKIVSGT